ncbi:MAG: hypothetical protein JXR83_02415 [Deltaproteobacteria bacterium]|nr:hypothetical protein [Deltaproteobacteria bacterium]
MVAAASVAAAPVAPGSATLLFVAEPVKVAVALAADFECRPAEPQRLACSYAARLWSTAPALAPSATAEHGPVLAEHAWSAQFNAPRPLDGWPERDELSLIWHGDGGYEVRTGATAIGIALATGPALPRPLAGWSGGSCQIAIAAAELRAGRERWRGLAVVERQAAGAARCLEQPGTALLTTGREGYALVRLVERASWRLSPDGSATPVDDPMHVMLVDGRTVGDLFVPTAVRLYTPQLELLLERRRVATTAAIGPLEMLRHEPLTGAGYLAGREVRAAAVVMPLRAE